MIQVPSRVAETREHRDACFEERRPQRHVEFNRGLTILADVATDDHQRWVDLMGLPVTETKPLVAGLAEFEQSTDVSRDLFVRIATHSGFGIPDEDHGKGIFVRSHRHGGVGRHRGVVLA